jgi:hypothetical protein
MEKGRSARDQKLACRKHGERNLHKAERTKRRERDKGEWLATWHRIDAGSTFRTLNRLLNLYLG